MLQIDYHLISNLKFPIPIRVIENNTNIDSETLRDYFLIEMIPTSITKIENYITNLKINESLYTEEQLDYLSRYKRFCEWIQQANEVKYLVLLDVYAYRTLINNTLFINSNSYFKIYKDSTEQIKFITDYPIFPFHRLSKKIEFQNYIVSIINSYCKEMCYEVEYKRRKW